MSRGRSRRRAAASLALALAAALAQANDRPFLLTSSAAAEEDDDGVWALESWWRRAGSAQALTVAPEYAFDPTNSLQLELSRGREDGSTGSAIELEFKHLFNHIGRDGWGWGMQVSVQAERTEGAGWTAQSLPIKLLFTLPLFQGDALLHLNGGLQFQRGEPREWIGSAAFEVELPWRSLAFAELGREERTTLVNVGLRHWIKRERFALDISGQQMRQGGSTSHGAVIGLAWYDF